MCCHKFGIATTDITPPIGVYLSGYDPRRSTSVGHPLRAEALACEGAAGGWILITADILGFNRQLVELIRHDIVEKTGLRSGSIMFTAVHTHSGPNVSMAIWNEEPEEKEYFKELRKKLADLAVQAWQDRTPGELLHARTSAPDIACNRRIQLPDGTWTNEWNDLKGTHDGYYDPTIELIGVRRPDGKLDGLLVNYGCHPVCFNSKNTAISGDYVSYLKDALERSGQVSTALFTVAGHANVDPKNCVQIELDVVRNMGERLAKIVLAAVKEMQPIGGEDVASANEAWTFQTTWTLGNSRCRIYFPASNAGDTVHTEFSGVSAGALALVGMPGETVSEYRAILNERSPFKVTLLISLANDFIGYLPTDQILEEGAYEAMLSPVRPIQETLLSGMDMVLKKLRGK